MSKLFGIFFLSLAFCSCFETIVDVDQVPFEKKLVISADLDILDSFHYINVSQNFELLSSEFLPDMIEASVKLTIPNGEILFFVYLPTAPDSIKENIPGNYSLEQYNFMFKGKIPIYPGEDYTIEVTFPGLQTASSSINLHQNIPLENYDLLLPTPEIGTLSINWLDPQNQNNFYSIDLRRFTANGEYYESVITTTDVAANIFYHTFGLLINDETFDGQNKSMSFHCNNITANSETLYYILHWDVNSKDHYEFEKAARLYEEAQRNPYLTSDFVEGNIVNGLGLFSLGYSNKYRIEI